MFTSFTFQLHAQVGVFLIIERADVFDETATDLAAVSQKLDSVAYTDVTGRAWYVGHLA
jgi:hypothetical protein